jgi:hypothetical protein
VEAWEQYVRTGDEAWKQYASGNLIRPDWFMQVTRVGPELRFRRFTLRLPVRDLN